MRKVFTKDDEEFQIFNEFWHITQEFYEPEASDEYWEKFLKALDDFESRHKDNPLCSKMILMLMSFVEDKYKTDKSAAYARLIKQVGYDYKNFVKKADKKDIKLLDEILKDNKDTTEGQLILSAVRIAAMN